MNSPKNIDELYSGEDLNILFKGNFINFGFWKNIPNFITVEDVIEANKALYHKVFDCLNLDSADSVLEVGSGHGGGASLLSSSYLVQSLTGLDYLPKHVERSKATCDLLNQKNIQFLQGKAESIPLPNSSINKIYTIEAFQHFDAQYAIPEFSRVLSPGGKVVISTFFAKDKHCFEELFTLLPKPAVLTVGNEELAALPEVLKLLKNFFKQVSIETIGESVWPGYDAWVKQNHPSIWDKNWRIAYEKGLMDYYVITVNL